MGKQTLIRATWADLEVRGGDGRTVAGIAVPFDEPTEINEYGRRYSEVFRRGAFAQTIRERGPKAVKAFAKHARERLPLGRAEVLREDAAGLWAELRISKTREGDEVLELVRDSALDGLSIGFQPIQDRWNRDRTEVERLNVKLLEISLVDYPAYAGAKVAGVRGAVAPVTLSREVATARLRLLEMKR